MMNQSELAVKKSLVTGAKRGKLATGPKRGKTDNFGSVHDWTKKGCLRSLVV